MSNDVIRAEIKQVEVDALVEELIYMQEIGNPALADKVKTSIKKITTKEERAAMFLTF